MVYPSRPIPGSTSSGVARLRRPGKGRAGVRLGGAASVPLGVWGVAVVQLGVFASGCVGQDGSRMVVSTNPALAALAAELLPDLARRSGMELREPVRVEERSREQLVRYLEHKLDEELPEEEERAIVDAYALLGLVPPDFDMREVLMGLYTEQVAGFYEPDSTALFVLDDQSESDLRGLLVHELVHAVQDQSADLDALTDPTLGSDRATAAQSAIEGHATLVMFEYIAEQQTGAPVDLGQIPGFGPMLRQNLEAARSRFPALASAPRVLQESLIFPYLEGAVFLQRQWARGQRLAPFGEHLPLSTEQILDGADAPAPVELAFEVAGGELVREDVLGRLELSVLLEEHVGAQGKALAAAWDGDRYALVERADGQRILVSYIVWEDEGTRDRVVASLGSALSRFGAGAAIEPARVAGRPATVLTIGNGNGVTVRVTDAGRQ